MEVIAAKIEIGTDVAMMTNSRGYLSSTYKALLHKLGRIVVLKPIVGNLMIQLHGTLLALLFVLQPVCYLTVLVAIIDELAGIANFEIISALPTISARQHNIVIS